MKSLQLLIGTYLMFSLSACCTSYCAECQNCHYIEVEFLDEQTGEDLTIDLSDEIFSIDGFANEVSVIRAFDDEHFYLDVSIAEKDKMEDVINLYYDGNLVETLNTSYVLNGDDACCEFRSVLVSNITTANGSATSSITTENYADFKVSLLISQ